MEKQLPELPAKDLPETHKKKTNIFQRIKKTPFSIGIEGSFKIQKTREIPRLPDLPKEQIDIKYPLLAPYAYAHIKWDDENQELTYKLEEPELELSEKRILNLLEEGIKELLNISYLTSTRRLVSLSIFVLAPIIFFFIIIIVVLFFFFSLNKNWQFQLSIELDILKHVTRPY